MQAKDQNAQKTVGRRIDADAHTNTKAEAMTSRGTKYWKSGTIPLIGPDILGDIISEVADIAVVIGSDGTVLSVLSNSEYRPAAQLEGIEGRPFEDFLTTESKPKFRDRLSEFRSGQTISNVELNHMDVGQRWEFPVRYSFHQIGPDDTILLLGTDLRPIAEMQQQLVKAQLALEKDFEQQREYDTRFRVLMHSTTEPHVFVSSATGLIKEANPAAAAFIGVGKDALPNTKLSDYLELDGVSDLIEGLGARALEGSTPVQGTLKGSDKSTLIYPTMFRIAGERLLLLRMQDEDSAIYVDDDLGLRLRTLHDTGPEGVVFVDDGGLVVSANEGFLDLIGLAHGVDVRGKSVTDFLMRGSVDLKVMTENAARYGRMRLYLTKIASDFGSPRSVEISVTALKAGTKSVFAFVMRDSNRAESTRTATPQTNDDVQSVVELVGSASLKEIVAESSDVIERMCIETALELTMNNRVAAAEMLGLSRQSLYVKLRKFGIHSSES